MSVKDKPLYSTTFVQIATGRLTHQLQGNITSGAYGFDLVKEGRNIKLSYNQFLRMMRVHKLAQTFHTSIPGAVFMIRLMEENEQLEVELEQLRKELAKCQNAK